MYYHLIAIHCCCHAFYDLEGSHPMTAMISYADSLIGWRLPSPARAKLNCGITSRTGLSILGPRRAVRLVFNWL